MLDKDLRSVPILQVAPSPNSSLHGPTSKRIKDIRNQGRVMIGSDLSLTGPDTDLEMDYYDYNVHNTSAVPGSYLGMDPAYCVWIPPFAPGQWMDNGSDEEDSSSINNDIEMQKLDGNGSRSETPYSEKFQKECRTREKERFKRNSSISTASSGNRTIMPEDITPDGDDLTIKDALMPDSRLPIQHAYVIKDAERAVKIPLLEKDVLKFADDDDDEDDCDTAYNSDTDLKKKDHVSNRRRERVIHETSC